jgi:hypothetical protein
LKATTFLTPHKVELAGRASGATKDSAIQNTKAVTGNQDSPEEGYTG